MNDDVPAAAPKLEIAVLQFSVRITSTDFNQKDWEGFEVYAANMHELLIKTDALIETEGDQDVYLQDAEDEKYQVALSDIQLCIRVELSTWLAKIPLHIQELLRKGATP